MNNKLLGRFKFTLKDNYKFNYFVVINILYLKGKLVLQVIDLAILFDAVRFLKNMSA
jgi:hypothetical protein